MLVPSTLSINISNSTYTKSSQNFEQDFTILITEFDFNISMCVSEIDYDINGWDWIDQIFRDFFAASRFGFLFRSG